jgi:hypothetical protein
MTYRLAASEISKVQGGKKQGVQKLIPDMFIAKFTAQATSLSLFC